MASPDVETPRLRSALSGYTSIIAGLVEEMPGVAYLELARPQRHNSFHEGLWDEFPRALQELDANDETRVIVIAGQGKNFCAGIDVGYLQRNFMALAGGSGSGGAASPFAATPKAPTPQLPPPPPPSSPLPPPSLRPLPPSRSPSAAAAAAPLSTAAARCPGLQRATMRRNILALQDAYSELERCRSPVIAAVHGRCIGGGVDLVTACDVRLCSEEATFCVKEVDLAIAADLGTLQRLPHIIGHGAAMDLALTARTVTAAEAHRLGLVSAVVPLDCRPPAATSSNPSSPCSTSTSTSASSPSSEARVPEGQPQVAGGGGGGGGRGGGGGGDGAIGGGGGGRRAVVGAALALAAAIASKPRLAVQGTKRVLLHARDQPRVADGLDYVATWNSAQLISNDLAAVFRAGAGGGDGGGGGGGGRGQGTGPRARL